MRLRGITWEHPRGYACLAATAEAYRDVDPGVRIAWEARSLREFGAVETVTLARRYDLLVIDHPHLGSSVIDESIVALDDYLAPDQLEAFAADSLGRSHESYHYDGRQWALAIDAAAQVSAYRPDLIEDPPTEWREVYALTRAGRVLWPLNPTDAFCSLLTLCANAGKPWCGTSSPPVPRDTTEAALACMKRSAELQPRSLDVNPIETLDLMSTSDEFVYSPLLFGYSNYARRGFRPSPIRFGPSPGGAQGSTGSLLGGAGIAISAWCRHPGDAARYAAWVAGRDCQRGLYFDAGGQPASRTAWEDARVNQISGGYFADTRSTLDHSWTRPRFPGFVSFQNEGGAVIHDFLRGERGTTETIAGLESLYQAVVSSEDRPGVTQDRRRSRAKLPTTGS